MESKLSDYRARTVYRIVTVLQAPFMMKDATGPFIADSSAGQIDKIRIFDRTMN
jgi:hypothetical protein